MNSVAPHFLPPLSPHRHVEEWAAARVPGSTIAGYRKWCRARAVWLMAGAMRARATRLRARSNCLGSYGHDGKRSSHARCIFRESARSSSDGQPRSRQNGARTFATILLPNSIARANTGYDAKLGPYRKWQYFQYDPVQIEIEQYGHIRISRPVP
jgi:hypothetical protein